MNPLTQIPGHVRTWLYWIGYVLGVISQGVTIIWGAIAAASPDVSMPLGLVIASAVIAFAQTQLNLLAGSNVVETRTMQITAPSDASTTLSADVRIAGDPPRTWAAGHHPDDTRGA